MTILHNKNNVELIRLKIEILLEIREKLSAVINDELNELIARETELRRATAKGGGNVKRIA